MTDSAEKKPEATLARDAKQIGDWIVERLAKEVGIPARRIQRGVDIKRYGLDSVVAVEVVTDLGDLLGAKLPPSLLWDYASIDAAVAAIISGEAEQAAAQKAAERAAEKAAKQTGEDK
jgi:acyl carrier protein